MNIFNRLYFRIELNMCVRYVRKNAIKILTQLNFLDLLDQNLASNYVIKCY